MKALLITVVWSACSIMMTYADVTEQRSEGEVAKPPASIATKLALISKGMSRKEVEEKLGPEWFFCGADNWNSGALFEYRSRAFPKLEIQIWFGWTERGIARDGKHFRKAGPTAPVLASPAVVETNFSLPEQKLPGEK
jgi:hypothetical protein